MKVKEKLKQDFETLCELVEKQIDDAHYERVSDRFDSDNDEYIDKLYKIKKKYF